MKKYFNLWLLCLILLFLGTVETHAQRFYFKELFKNCVYKYEEKQTPQTFYAADKSYGHQWKLTVDGALAHSTADCLHVGTGKDASQIIRLETTTPFKDVDLVRVSTDMAKGRKGRGYEVSMTLGLDNDKFSSTRKYTKKEDLNDDLSNLYITKGNIDSDKIN